MDWKVTMPTRVTGSHFLCQQRPPAGAMLLATLMAALFVVAGPASSAGNAAADVNHHRADSARSPQKPNPSQDHPRVMAASARLPLSFERNQGQTDPRVRFIARGDGYTVLLGATQAVLRLRGGIPRQRGKSAVQTGASAAAGAEVRMKLVGANAKAPAAG